MKICVIGPVATRDRTGGVATFVEGLADGFTEIGHGVIILTNQADKCKTEAGTQIVNLECSRKSKFITQTKKYLRENTQDIIIGSTWYDLALCIDSKISGKKIHYLHGFGIPRDGLIRAFAIAINDKLHKRNCFLIANSSFTKMINEIFYRTKVDAVIPIGISHAFKEATFNVEPKKQKELDVIYVGRVRFNKGPEKIIDALQYIREKYRVELNCAMVGDGPQLPECKEKCQKAKLNILFTGKLEQSEIVKYYKESKVFVSLDPKEPYGQTFIEALMCGCNIVCPSSGGQIEYLAAYKDYCQIADCYSVPSIGEAIYTAYLKKNIPVDSDKIFQEHSYERVAENIIHCLD